MNGSRRALTLGMVILVILGGVPAVTSAETTTLTVTVENRNGAAVSDATITATWEGGSTTATTANNGKAFVDVPDDTRVELTIEHDQYVRNFPFVIQNPSSESEVTVQVAAKSSLSLSIQDSDEAIEDARVVVRQDGRIVADGWSAADGGFETDTIEAGTYNVAVLKPEYYEKRTNVEVSGETIETVTIQSGSVAYEFNVTDSHFETAKPVAGATVELDGIGTVKTAQDGLATARIPVNTEVEMTVTKDGYETKTRTLTIGESGVDVNVDLQRTPGLTVKPANQRVVAGEDVIVTVVDEYGDPVEGVTVTRNGDSVAETDSNGQAAVTLDEAGTYELSATNDGLTAPRVEVDAVNPAGTDTSTTTTTSMKTDSADNEPATTATSPTPTEEDVDVPGFGILASLLSLLGIGFWHRLRGDAQP